MEIETVYLDRSLGDVSGTLTNPANALGPPDGVYAGSEFTSSWEHRFGFTNLEQPTLGAGQQVISVAATGGSSTLQVTLYRGATEVAATSRTVNGPTTVTLEWTDPGGSTADLILTLRQGSVPLGAGILIDAATWTVLTEDPAPSSPWSLWDGTQEIPLAFEGVADGSGGITPGSLDVHGP